MTRTKRRIALILAGGMLLGGCASGVVREPAAPSAQQAVGLLPVGAVSIRL